MPQVLWHRANPKNGTLIEGGAEQDVSWSFQRIPGEPYVLFPKQQKAMNQIKETEMAQEALWKYKMTERKAERDAIKMERDMLKTKEIEWKA
ncbi:hypothetical protein NPIL_681751 [Nephila pilipes]|uniref:Uncharacterized protein n=1 Tax=Nephila pilipes TaxID=299642 RepID=A0A8X6PWX8_NEPPI|nr:hypothetical protein NPIL_681751 [Nephila pilipes]